MIATDNTANIGDEALLRAARAGDREALEHLLLRYQRTVYAYGMRMCGNPHDAEDVLQDTLLTMARSVHDFRGASSLSTWLYAIARSFCIKRRRRKSGVGETISFETATRSDAAHLADPQSDPERETATRQLETVLAEAIAELTPAYRDVLVLRDIEGLAATQVAEIVGISVQAVKSRLHRARLAVRAKLAPLMDDSSHVQASGPRSCPDVLLMFSKHLEGEITGAICAEMERHLHACPRCRDACASLQRTLALCRHAPAAHVPVALQSAIRKRLRAALAQKV